MSYKLFNQMKKGGRFVTPVSSPRNKERQFIWFFNKNKQGEISGKKTLKESYVDIQSAEKQVKAGLKNIY